MNLFDVAIPQFAKQLTTIDRWLDAAAAHGKHKSFDPELLLHSRLAPDQFALVRQIQSACDTAKLAAARLAGKVAPSHADVETSIDHLRARLKAVIEYLGTFEPADFEGATERPIMLSWAPGKLLRGEDYLIQFAIPNFYFHVVTTYAILRHNGVVLGKADFINGLPFRDA